MAISEHNPGIARGVDHKEAIRIALDEVLTAFEECLDGLTNEQAWAFPLPGRHCIATIAMHCQQNLDNYAVHFQTGAACLEHDERFDMWQFPDGETPGPMPDMPSVATMLDRARAIRAAAMPAIESAGNDDLAGPRHCKAWWLESGRQASDAYWRTIHHTQAHIRQIWMLRGAMGMKDAAGWPEQHWA